MITAASLKLFPKIRSSATAFAAVPDVRSAVDLLARLREASGDRVSSFELIPRIGIDLTTQHIPGVIDPLQKPLRMVRAVRTHVRARRRTSRCGDGGGAGERIGGRPRAGRGAVAQTSASARPSGSCVRRSPKRSASTAPASNTTSRCPSPRCRDFVERASPGCAPTFRRGGWSSTATSATATCTSTSTRRRASDRDSFLAREPAIKRAIHDLVREFGGSFSAEHGIGRLKVGELERYASPVELDLMRAVKQALDPNGVHQSWQSVARVETPRAKIRDA